MFFAEMKFQPTHVRGWFLSNLLRLTEHNCFQMHKMQIEPNFCCSWNRSNILEGSRGGASLHKAVLVMVFVGQNISYSIASQWTHGRQQNRRNIHQIYYKKYASISETNITSILYSQLRLHSIVGKLTHHQSTTNGITNALIMAPLMHHIFTL